MRYIYFIIFFFSFQAFAQKTVWVNFGAGKCGTEKHSPYYTMGGSLNIEYSKKLFAVRVTRTREFNIFVDPDEEFNDAGLLYGFVSSGHKHRFTAAAGISFTNGLRRGNFIYDKGGTMTASYYNKNRWYTVGIPAEVQLYFTPFKCFGFGMTGFANLNTERSFLGFLFSLQAGIIK